MDEYIIAVPRGDASVDFADQLKGIDGLRVAKAGTVRRVLISADTEALAEVRSRLPGVRIEPVRSYKTSLSMSD